MAYSYKISACQATAVWHELHGEGTLCAHDSGWGFSRNERLYWRARKWRVRSTVCGMMARRGALAVLAGGLTVLLSACGIGSKSTYRFKMTVEVETPQGLRSGSSVYEVMARNMPGLDPSGIVREKRLRGEAVAVNLPGGKTLFVLLKSERGEGLDWVSMATLDPAFQNDWVESARRISDGDGIRTPAEVAPKNYPMLVTFGDIADPKSVTRADPANFATSLGYSARLKRIAIEVTDEKVTWGIKKRLAWLSEHPEPSLNPEHGPNDFSISATTRHGDFKRGAAK